MMLSVSILAADFGNLKKEIYMINNSDADFIHVDIMDGLFVPSISFGDIILKIVEKYSSKPIDVHLMINDPINYLYKILQFKINSISIHYESTNNLYNVISLIKKYNIKVGLVLNPYTSINVLDNIIYDIDILTIMGVNPGLGGQRLIDFTFTKLLNIIKLIKNKGLQILIQIDGGVNEKNASSLLRHGAHILVSGSYVFNNINSQDIIKRMKNID